MILTVLGITLPFFILIFLGAFLRFRNFLTDQNSNLLSKFAFYALMPPLIFSKISIAPASELWNPGFVIRYEIVTIILFIFAYPIGSIFGQDSKGKGIVGLNMAYPNYGYIGVPLCLIAFGDRAALPLALIAFADTIVLLLMATIYTSFSRNGKTTYEALKLIPKSLIGNPLLLAAVFGIIFSVFSIRLPFYLNSVINMLAEAAPPVALIALGSSLSLGVFISNKTEMIFISMLKVFIHPILIAIAFLLFKGQEPLWIKTAILSASLPVAANVFMLATYYGSYREKSATLIMLSTVISSISVPVVLYCILTYV
jgi:malonate transporter